MECKVIASNIDNFLEIGSILGGFYSGDIEKVLVKFVHPEYGCQRDLMIKSGHSFMSFLPEIYDYGFDIEYITYYDHFNK